MLKWQASMLSRIGSIVLVGSIAGLGWQHLGPRKPEIGPVRKELADKLIPSIVEDIRTSRESVRQVALLHFENDPTDYFTDLLRLRIEQGGIMDLPDRTLGEKICNLLNLRHRSFSIEEDAVERGKKLGCQGVVFGTIHSFESYPGGAKLDVEINLAEVPSGAIIFTKRYTEDSPVSSLSRPAVREGIGKIKWFQRLFAWVIAVLLLPIFSISFIRAMLRKKSNRVNAFVLAIYTVVDALLAYLLVGAVLNSLWTLLFFIAAVGAAFAYNIRIVTFALRLEE